MEKYIITTGKSIDLAISSALAELHLDRDAVSVEVLENAKAGFLGIGASPAKVKVTYEASDLSPAEPTPALSAASRKPKKQAPKLEKPLEMPPLPKMPEPPKTTAPKKESARQEKAEHAKKQTARKETVKKDSPKKEAAKDPLMPRSYAPAEPGSQEERVERFIKGLLERMDSSALPHAFRKDDETISVELSGEELGLLIGRRGETLDAIQHLANYALNHDAAKRTRVTVDAENYRGKREESLRHLAHKMASKVVKYRRSMTLEPMNAYERHIIHATLQDAPNITTYSIGAEPNRRVVVAYEK